MSVKDHGRTLDRYPSQNERRLTAFPFATTEEPRSYTWGIYTQLDQGSEGACVGFGWAHELAARPAIVTGIDNDDGRLIYHEAQKIDEWAGEAYDGTSVDAGAKIVKARGFMQEYRWATTLKDLLVAVGRKGGGPVVMGTWWKDTMWDTDDAGFLDTSGDNIGGHCWLVRGVSVTKQEVLCRNSWGTDWGLYGDFRLKWDQLEVLFEEDGEACIPIGRDKVGDL